jgi:hypothetical protein
VAVASGVSVGVSVDEIGKVTIMVDGVVVSGISVSDAPGVSLVGDMSVASDVSAVGGKAVGDSDKVGALVGAGVPVAESPWVVTGEVEATGVVLAKIVALALGLGGTNVALGEGTLVAMVLAGAAMAAVLPAAKLVSSMEPITKLCTRRRIITRGWRTVIRLKRDDIASPLRGCVERFG